MCSSKKYVNKNHVLPVIIVVVSNYIWRTRWWLRCFQTGSRWNLMSASRSSFRISCFLFLPAISVIEYIRQRQSFLISSWGWFRNIPWTGFSLHLGRSGYTHPWWGLEISRLFRSFLEKLFPGQPLDSLTVAQIFSITTPAFLRAFLWVHISSPFFTGGQ